jgi:hypothetical protein
MYHAAEGWCRYPPIVTVGVRRRLALSSLRITRWITSYTARGQVFEAVQVFLGHPLGRKPLLKYPSDIATIQSVKCANCFDSLGFILHDKSGHAMVYNLEN